MVGLFLVAGVALLLSSVKGSAAPSSAESTSPEAAKKRTKPSGLFGGAARGEWPIPPKGSRTLGPDQVADPRYDFKGGLPALAVEKAVKPSPVPTKVTPAVRPARGVAVMPPTRTSSSLPSRFRIPLRVPLATKPDDGVR